MFIQSIKSQLQRHYYFVQTISLTFVFSFFRPFKTGFPLQTTQPLLAKQQLRKRDVIRNYHFLTIAFAVALLSSCQKEKLNSTALNSTTSANSDEARIRLPFQFRGDNTTTINYGALIGAPDPLGSLDFQLNVAGQLGVSCLRARTLVPAASLTTILNTDYEILLNFNTVDYTGESKPYETDTAKYRQELEDILSTFTVMPVVAVIENEECNKIFTSSSPEEYLKLLTIAIDVMHAHDIKVANGGLTYVGLNYLVYQDYMNRGMEAEAADFQSRTNVQPNAQFSQDRGAVYEKLLQAYTRNGLDYVNFHWKGSSPDAKALGEVIDYLKKTTGKPVITNELGQIDEDPNTLLTHVQKCADEKLPYILWYSPDENDGKYATPLQYNTAILTPTGIAYQGYLLSK